MTPTEHCWRRIGVYGGGDQSCEKLAEVLHCRNCPTFRSAARTLFERESPPTPSRDLLGTEVADTGVASLLLFRLGSQWLGLPPSLLVEIATTGPIRRLAHRAGGLIEGVVGVRGELHLCVALSELLDLGRRSASGAASERLVLVRGAHASALAFRADEVRGLVHAPATGTVAPPQALTTALARVLSGFFDHPLGRVGVLEPTALILLLEEALFR